MCNAQCNSRGGSLKPPARVGGFRGRTGAPVSSLGVVDALWGWKSCSGEEQPLRSWHGHPCPGSGCGSNEGGLAGGECMLPA